MATINISKIKKEIDKYKNKKKEIILAVHMEQGRNLKVLLWEILTQEIECVIIEQRNTKYQ